MNIHALLGITKQINDNLSQLPGLEPINNHQPVESFDSLIQDKDLRMVVQRLYKDGHHARAVEEAFKFANNLVKQRAQVDPSYDGSKLMKYVFSLNDPKLAINSLISQSEKDEQLGYMELFSGCMTGIRNPRAHEHDWEDTEHRALQLLVLADHMVERIKKAVKINKAP